MARERASAERKPDSEYTAMTTTSEFIGVANAVQRMGLPVTMLRSLCSQRLLKVPTESTEARIYSAMARLVLKRLERAPASKTPHRYTKHGVQ